MSWHAFRGQNRVRQSRRRWRRAGVAVALGLALAVAACGSTTGGGSQPTSTPKPTATMLPSPTPTPASWRVVPSPNVTYQGPSANYLYAVSALSPSDAWAVGGTFAGAPGPAASLIERWDGTAWHIVANPGTGNLYGVAAMAANDVWAVGRQGGQWDDKYQQYVYTTLIMHWNGTQWSVVPSPNPDLIESYLSSVAAISANDVWAVGYTGYAPGVGDALIEHWDGKVWSVVSSPRPQGSTGGVYAAVTHIPGTNQLWAVGYTWYGTTGGVRTIGYFQPLIERWDGSAWHIVASPSLPSGAFSTDLNSILALSATDAWAVGDYIGSDHTAHTLIIHWDGASWKVVTGPDQRGSLSSVAAAGAHDVRAVGYILTGDTNKLGGHLLIEQWNGAAWQVVPSPEPSGAPYSDLSSVMADRDGAYWAVGSYTSPKDSSSMTLIARCP